MQGNKPNFKKENVLILEQTKYYDEGRKEMITINHCLNCGANFLIPEEYSNGLDVTIFICPECYSKNWEKLTDSPTISKQLFNEEINAEENIIKTKQTF